MSLWINLALNGLAVGGLYFLIASGLSLIFGLMEVLNFAHGSLFMAGAYVALQAWKWTGSFWAGILVGTAAGLAIAAAMERVAIRPLYGRPVFQILLTLGLVLVLDELVKLVWGPTAQPVPALPPALRGVLQILDHRFPVYRLFIIGVAAAVLVLVYLFLTRTRLGIIIRAGVEDAGMVAALGVDVQRVFTLVFALGGALAAFGGAVSAPFFGVFPAMGFENLLNAFIVVVIGGFGSFAGSAAASALVGLSGAFGGYYLPKWAAAINVGLMALVLLWRPTGLFGRKG